MTLSGFAFFIFGVSAFAASREIPISKNYKDVQAFMQKLAADHPKTVQLFNMGVADSGATIQGVKIGSADRANVRMLVVATHHGNEYGSTEVAKAFAQSVAETPIVGQTVYVIPVLNTQGFDQRSRYERDGKGRATDPNRDYPGPCGTEGPWHLKSTAALAQFVDHENIVGSATLHTYSPAVVYPWGISTHDLSTHYDDIFKMLVQAGTVESQYPSGNNTDLIYPADGTFEDYAFWKHGIWSILYELGTTHNPSQAQVRELERLNVPGLRRQLEQTPRERAEKHAFEGKCDMGLRSRDKHSE